MKQPVSQDQLKEWLAKPVSELYLVDIRSNAEFDSSHIPASQNIPAESLIESSADWNKNSLIVCVCNRGHERSQNAAEQLSENGFTNVYYLEGGVKGWFGE